jgi:hypothetical protein
MRRSISLLVSMVLLSSCTLDLDDSVGTTHDEEHAIDIAAPDIVLSGPNGSVTITNMTGNGLTVRYSPGRTYTWARLYLSEGNGTGLVRAAQDMAYADGSYSYRFTHPTFVSGAAIHVLVLRYDGAAETPIPQGNLATASSWARFDYAGSSPGDPGGDPGDGAGTFPIVFQNQTRGTWSNGQIYVQVIGMNAAGRWCTLRPNGQLVPMSPADNDAPGHLRKNGVSYANYGATLASASQWTMPAYITGGRVYISVGSPLYIRAVDNGWVGPDVQNPADPNQDVYYDWIELTYAHNAIPFGGNTTQVDMFGLPLTMRLQQSSSGYDSTVGIDLPRAEVYRRYRDAVAPAFDALATSHRILAPFHGEFRPGRSQAGYLQGYIDQAWTYYASHPLTYRDGGVTYAGSVVGGRLRFTRNGAGPFFVDKPTTHDVLAASGALATGSPIELAFEAQLDAAFNRGVVLDTASWTRPDAYYATRPRNDYAMFFHQVGLLGRAYGFAYDDVNDQSTVRILSNARPPSQLTVGIGW